MTTRDWGVFALHHGDCLDVLRGLADASVDSVVTDPPYGLAFMGKKWDYDVPKAEVWAECLRVLKPGGHMVAFGGTRTYHRLACAIEDGGFEIRDQIGWAFGSGFPKSHNGEWGGTALKPAWEPICLARKALIGTVEANWAEHGTGALNIDGCRVPFGEGDTTASAASAGKGAGRATANADAPAYGKGMGGVVAAPHDLGRWPANLIHDGSDEVLAAFPQAPGQQGDVSDTAPSAKTSNVYGAMARVGEASQDSDNGGVVGFKMKPGARRLDSGSAARFFYCAKASKKDRDEGCEGLPQRVIGTWGGDDDDLSPGKKSTVPRGNTHPTVKPTDLMRYLCSLVTPPGGLVLDPFAGSGSTGKGAALAGLHFVGVERELAYVDIAERRIATAYFGRSAFGEVA
ncbi:MAG TPA: site-specific DNA-methyltransferase [Rubrivivax sp.]|nr:site-specific DNA-methyltransferase [Rubrivivax sp.]HRZ62870.1 site-specific DNA-methyltransferase [Rubrivivax sp.]